MRACPTHVCVCILAHTCSSGFVYVCVCVGTYLCTHSHAHTHTLIYLSVVHTQTRTHIIPLYLFELRNCENVKVVSCAMSIFRKRVVRERVRDKGRDGEREGWRERERD